MGEKTGWTYIDVPQKIAQRIYPGNKKPFRIKGSIDGVPVKGMTLMPMGGGDFIMALNADIRKALKKKSGDKVAVEIETDTQAYELNPDFIECLQDDPAAMDFFRSLPGAHQNYYSKWIDSAKTETTRTRRIAQSVTGLSKKMNYAEMLRYFRTQPL